MAVGKLQRGARCQPRPSCTSGSCCLGCSAHPQLPALKSTDCTSGPHCVFCFQDRKDESGKTATEKNQLFHKDEQEGDYGLKSPHTASRDECHAALQGCHTRGDFPLNWNLAGALLRRDGYLMYYWLQ